VCTEYEIIVQFVAVHQVLIRQTVRNVTKYNQQQTGYQYIKIKMAEFISQGAMYQEDFDTSSNTLINLMQINS